MILQKRIRFFALFLSLVIVFGPIPVSASGGYITLTRSLQKKLNALDDNKVKNIPLPILFGVKLTSLTPNFGDARGGGERSHEGLDIMAAKGLPVVSPTEAVVLRTGTGPSSGKYVTTMNPGDETFIYMHLNEISVNEGDVLKVGDLIGFVGNTGNAAGGASHLHFEIRDAKRKPVDPFPRITKELSKEERTRSLTSVIEVLKKELAKKR